MSLTVLLLPVGEVLPSLVLRAPVTPSQLIVRQNWNLQTQFSHKINKIDMFRRKICHLSQYTLLLYLGWHSKVWLDCPNTKLYQC